MNGELSATESCCGSYLFPLSPSFSPSYADDNAMLLISFHIIRHPIWR